MSFSFWFALKTRRPQKDAHMQDLKEIIPQKKEAGPLLSPVNCGDWHMLAEGLVGIAI